MQNGLKMMDDVKCIEQTDGHATEAKVLYVFYVKKRMYIMTNTVLVGGLV